MSVKRMHHVGIVVDDLPAAIAFFGELGLELEGEAQVGGDWVGRIIGLESPVSDIAMLSVPGELGRIELVSFRSPPNADAGPVLASNVPGLRHLAFEVGDLEGTLERLAPHGATLVGAIECYEDIYRLCYVHGPANTIIELAEPLAG